jgi:hypothetical protein
MSAAEMVASLGEIVEIAKRANDPVDFAHAVAEVLLQDGLITEPVYDHIVGRI